MYSKKFAHLNLTFDSVVICFKHKVGMIILYCVPSK